MAENVLQSTGVIDPVLGTGGVAAQVPGQMASVSGAAAATGGIAAGNFIEADIDKELFQFNSDDTPLMQLMLSSKKVVVDSPKVTHFMVDEPRAALEVASNVTAQNAAGPVVLPLADADKSIPQEHTTLLVCGVEGADGRDLMLFVTGIDANTGNPICRPINGDKTNVSDAFGKCPAIPANSKVIVLSNALYETQKEVAPDLIVPQPSMVYLQKRAMNNIVSDYFDAQRKRIPFSKAVIAEQAIATFKNKGNRTLWAGIPGEITINTKLGQQLVYTTEGVRWQFKREIEHSGSWTYEQLIGLAKMFFTGEDAPKTAIALCGKDFLEGIQCIDFSHHPEVQISSKTNPIGWTVTNIHTVFGDIELKREPTLDKLGLSRSAGIFGENRLVHYVYKSETSFNEDIEGQEAKRSGIIVWDALALKGNCHIWVDGEGSPSNANAVVFEMWDSTTAPTVTNGTASNVYYLLAPVPTINANATAGTFWQFNGTSWVEYSGVVSA